MSVFKRRIEEVSSTDSESSDEEDDDREKMSRYSIEEHEQNANSSTFSEKQKICTSTKTLKRKR